MKLFVLLALCLPLGARAPQFMKRVPKQADLGCLGFYDVQSGHVCYGPFCYDCNVGTQFQAGCSGMVCYCEMDPFSLICCDLVVPLTPSFQPCADGQCGGPYCADSGLCSLELYDLDGLLVYGSGCDS